MHFYQRKIKVLKLFDFKALKYKRFFQVVLRSLETFSFLAVVLKKFRLFKRTAEIVLAIRQFCYTLICHFLWR